MDKNEKKISKNRLKEKKKERKKGMYINWPLILVLVLWNLSGRDLNLCIGSLVHIKL